jgi:hypothetical protein
MYARARARRFPGVIADVAHPLSGWIGLRHVRRAEHARAVTPGGSFMTFHAALAVMATTAVQVAMMRTSLGLIRRNYARPRARRPYRRLPRLTPHDVHDRVLAQADVAADQSVGQAFGVHVEHALGLLVGGALTRLAAELDASSLCRGKA